MDNLHIKIKNNDFINPRSFNRIEINHDTIKKTSKNDLLGEIYFYKNVPSTIKDYFPSLIEYDTNTMVIDKINGINLSRLFTQELLTPVYLCNLLYTMKNIHSCNVDVNVNIYANYTEKIKKRYEMFDYTIFKDERIVYKKIIDFLYEYEKNKKGKVGVIHGDPVFSNIILTANKFMFIDMRGKQGNELTIFGDIFYDYAKMYQSILGYDEIITNTYVSDTYRKSLLDTFHNFINDNFGEDTIPLIKMITNSLFFSLIPLHNDENIFRFFNLINLNT